MTGITKSDNKVTPDKDPEKNGMPPPYDASVAMPPTILGPRPIVDSSEVPRDYLGFSLFTALFCFWPVGLFGVIKSRNVHRNVWRGDMPEARKASRWAFRLSVITLVLGLICWGLLIACKLSFLWRDDDDEERDHHRGGHHHGGYHDDHD